LAQACLARLVEIAGCTVLVVYDGRRLESVGEDDVGVHGRHVQMIDQGGLLSGGAQSLSIVSMLHSNLLGLEMKAQSLSIVSMLHSKLLGLEMKATTTLHKIKDEGVLLTRCVRTYYSQK
jgi:hypothetical protein